MTGAFRIEPLASGDPAELAALHIQVWREAYTGMLSQQYLDGMRLEPRTKRWREWVRLDHEREDTALGADEPLDRVLFARHVNSHRIAGVCRVGTARENDAPSRQELGSLNVLAEFHGTGVAQQLVAATLGDRAAYLWVVRENLRAQAFYGKLGFTADGGTKCDETLACVQIRMVRSTPTDRAGA